MMHMISLATLPLFFMLNIRPLLADEPSPPHYFKYGSSVSILGPGVTPQDFMLQPVPEQTPINAPIWDYAEQWGPHAGIKKRPAVFEVPMYEPFNRDDPKWWDEELDEMLFARTPLVLVHGRGCNHPETPSDHSGDGNMCPHLLSKLAEAVDRAGAGAVARFGMWIDTGSLLGLRDYAVAPNSGRLMDGNNHRLPMDMTDRPDAAGHRPTWYFWDANIEPWFDTVPRALWYLYDDNGMHKPIIALWSIKTFSSNQVGNLRSLLQEIQLRFSRRYGLMPFFIVTNDWVEADPTLAGPGSPVGGVEGWFVPKFPEPDGTPTLATWNGKQWSWTGTRNGTYTTMEWAGKTWGAMVASFSCGPTCGQGTVGRNGGRSLKIGLEANRSSAINIVEGLDDTQEGNGLMRSDEPAWDFTNQYLDLLREASDPTTHTILFQAESADSYTHADGKPATEFRYNKALGIVPLGKADGQTGWALGSTSPGESFTFKQIFLAPGHYTFTARVSAATDRRLVHFMIDDVAFPTAVIPNTGDLDMYAVIALGSVDVSAGRHDLTLTTDTGGVNVDWFFSKKVSP